MQKNVTEINVFDVVFFALSTIAVVMSVFLPKQDLNIVVPLVIWSLIALYLDKSKKKYNFLFVTALFLSSISSFLSITNFNEFYILITTTTSLYLIGFSIVLKKYLLKGRLKTFLSLPVLISVVSFGYLIYTIIKFMTDFINNNELFFTIICALAYVVYIVCIGVIYLNDVYENRTLLLASGVLLLIQIGLSTMNEFLFYTRTFTVIILIAHFASVYFLVLFILKTKVLKDKDIKEQFI